MHVACTDKAIIRPRLNCSRLGKITTAGVSRHNGGPIKSLPQTPQYDYGCQLSRKSTISCSFSCRMQFQFSETTFEYKSQHLFSSPLNAGSNTIWHRTYITRQVSSVEIYWTTNPRFFLNIYLYQWFTTWGLRPTGGQFNKNGGAIWKI